MLSYNILYEIIFYCACLNDANFFLHNLVVRVTYSIENLVRYRGSSKKYWRYSELKMNCFLRVGFFTNCQSAYWIQEIPLSFHIFYSLLPNYGKKILIYRLYMCSWKIFHTNAISHEMFHIYYYLFKMKYNISAAF